MRCPNCNLVLSNKKDICPQCHCDLRPHKQRLGIPVTNSASSYEELRTGVSPAGQEQNTISPGGRSWLGKLLTKPAEQPKAETVREAVKTLERNEKVIEWRPPAKPQAITSIGSKTLPAVEEPIKETKPAPPAPKQHKVRVDESLSGRLFEPDLVPAAENQDSNGLETYSKIDSAIEGLGNIDFGDPDALQKTAGKKKEDDEEMPEEEELDLLFSRINKACAEHKQGNQIAPVADLLSGLEETTAAGVEEAKDATSSLRDKSFVQDSGAVAPKVIEFKDDGDGLLEELDEIIGDTELSVEPVRKKSPVLEESSEHEEEDAEEDDDGDLEITFELDGVDGQDEAELLPQGHAKAAAEKEANAGQFLSEMTELLSELYGVPPLALIMDFPPATAGKAEPIALTPEPPPPVPDPGTVEQPSTVLLAAQPENQQQPFRFEWRPPSARSCSPDESQVWHFLDEELKKKV